MTTGNFRSGLIPDNYEQTFNDTQFYNVIMLSKANNQNNIRALQRLINKSEEVIELIDTELKNR